jgi:non-specific serine/threonine protein kinase
MAGHSLDRIRGLPVERSSFVGRRAELARTRRLLSGSRLVTLVGPGGVGKTRLAVRAGTDLRRSFTHGVTLADLTAVSDPARVVEHVARALDVRDVSGRWLPATVAEVIGSRQVLLVLDNCEHLRDACAVLVDTLLATCADLRVLTTSRVPLDVDGEAVLWVPPLGVPPLDRPPGAGPGTAGPPSEAVQLLTQRATAAVPGLVLTPADDAALADVCRRLDGLPLAIELAAVRLRTLTPADLADRLDDRFGLLRRSGTAVPERHRTLQATMEWSAELLTEPDRVLWRRAAVFAGDFDLPAAESVCADDALPPRAVLDALGRLVEASLLEAAPGPRGRRFRMLETVRAYGRELLDAAGESRPARIRHVDWCADLVASASADFPGPGQVAAFDRLAAVHAELGAALDLCLAVPGERERGLGIAADLWLYWAARGHLGEGRRRLHGLLDACGDPSPARARGLLAAGFLALAATDPATAVPLLEQARELGEGCGPPSAVAMATQYLGQAALFGGDLARADRLLREAAAQHAGLDARYEAFCWADIGVVALLADRAVDAAAAFGRSLSLAERGDPWTRSHALWGLGLVRLTTGDPDEAARLERSALGLMREVDDRSGTALCIEALSWAAAAQQAWDRAARLSGAAEAVWRSIPAELPAPMGARRDDCTTAARRALGDRRWAALHRAGAALDRTGAVALALDEQPAAAAPATAAEPGPLTARQLQVAALVAEGLTDRQIAARLVISPRTAESHVEQILARLGVRSRAEIAAWTAARTAVAG